MSRWWVLLVLGLGLTAFLVPPASRLQVRADLADLLPQGQPASDDYHRFLEIFGGVEDVYVVVTDPGGAPDDPDALIEAAESLAEALAEAEGIAAVRTGVTDEDEAFFVESVLPRIPLLAADAERSGMAARLGSEAIARRVASVRDALRGPVGGLGAELLTADPFGMAADLGWFSPSAAGMPVDEATGAFLSPSGQAALLIVTPRAGELNSREGRVLIETLQVAFEGVRRDHGDHLGLEAAGGPLYAAQDEALLRADLIRTVGGSVAVITVLLLLYFRGARIPLALVLAVIAGIAWTAGVLTFSRGVVSFIGLSFAAILVGLGVDYGIHTASRFRQALLDGLGRAPAMGRAIAETAPAILASVLTTGFAFAVLGFSALAPVREMGLTVALGIGCIVLASASVGAPLLVLVPGRATAPREPGSLWRAILALVGKLSDLGHRRRGPVVVLAILLTAVALPGLTHLQFDEDLRALRPDEHPALRAEQLLASEFSFGLDRLDVAVRGDDLDQALARARRVARVLRSGEGMQVSSPSDTLVDAPAGSRSVAFWQTREVDRAVGLYEAELERRRLRVEPFRPALEILRGLGRGTLPAPVDPHRWPDWLRRAIRTDGRETWVTLQARAPTGRWPGGPPAGVVAAIRGEVPDALIASAPLVGREIHELVGHELRRLSTWCLAVVALLVLVSLRGDVGAAIRCLIPVGLASVWLLGFCGHAGLRLDLFSITSAPLLLGIGIDDGLHALHGARRHGTLLESVRRVGPAMTLTTLTTSIGFGSLLLSHVPALRRGGVLVAAGTLICLLLSLTLLPAVAPRGPEGRSG